MSSACGEVRLLGVRWKKGTRVASPVAVAWPDGGVSSSLEVGTGAYGIWRECGEALA